MQNVKSEMRQAFIIMLSTGWWDGLGSGRGGDANTGNPAGRKSRLLCLYYIPLSRMLVINHPIQMTGNLQCYNSRGETEVIRSKES